MREVQFLKKRSVPEFCLVKIVNLKVEIRPPRLVVLKLAVIDTDTWNPVGDSFTIKYHDMNDVVDFLVLQQVEIFNKTIHSSIELSLTYSFF
jgi:hypothetical protein